MVEIQPAMKPWDGDESTSSSSSSPIRWMEEEEGEKINKKGVGRGGGKYTALWGGGRFFSG